MPFNFKRTQKSKPIRLTERDDKIMLLTYELGLVSLNAVLKATGGSSYESLRKRTTQLCAHGYLDYPEFQDTVYGYREGKGNRPAIIHLRQQGAEHLSQRYGVPLGATNWNQKSNRRGGGDRGISQFEHDVGANDVTVALRTAYAAREGFRVLGKSEMIEQSPVATREMNSDPFSLPVRYYWPEDNQMYERNLKPDGVFAYTTGGSEPQTWLTFIEFDMKSEPTARGLRGGKDSATRTSIWQKLAMYNALVDPRTGSHILKQRFGINHFQVMFVSKASPTQLSNIVEASQEFHRLCGKQAPRGRFFFTSLDQFNSFPNPLEKIWWNSAGGCRGFR